MDRAALQAHLTLHGWVPVGQCHGDSGCGLRNDDARLMTWYTMRVGAVEVSYMPGFTIREWPSMPNTALFALAASVETLNKKEEKYGNETHIGAGARVGAG